MLYISRLASGENYGVMDTDDGVEEIVSFKELKRIVLKDKVGIKGVSVVRHQTLKSLLGQTDGTVLKPEYSIEVEVYQPVAERSLKQVKNATISGVNVIKNGDVVTGIKVSATGKPVTIRLSDFGTKFDGYVFSKHPRGISDLQLTFILDDSIKCTSRSFMYWEVYCKMDISEVTDIRIINNLVSPLFKDNSAFIYIRDQLIASKEIKDYIYGVMLLNGCEFKSYNATMGGIDAVRKSLSQAGVDLLHKYCIKEFSGLGNCKFIFNSDLSRAKKVASRARSEVDFGDFVQWRNFLLDEAGEHKSHLLAQLRQITTLNKEMLSRLEKYLKYFNAADPVKKEVVQFCCRAVEAIEAST